MRNARPITEAGLTPQEEKFVRLIATEGLNIQDAATHPEVAVSRVTGYTWMKRDVIKAAIREELSNTREENQRTARAKRGKAWRTIENALGNPNITPTQLKAAMFVIMQSNGQDKNEDSGVTFHLEVNTQLNMNAAAEQAARHAPPAQIIEGGFTLVDEDE